MASQLSGQKKVLTFKLLHRFFERQAARIPDEIALIFEDGRATKQISFAEINARSNQMANQMIEAIRTNGMMASEKGDWIVAICMKPSIELIVTMLAVWKAGAGYLPIDVDFPRIRILHILEEAKPLMVFFDDDFKHAEVFCDVTAYTFGEFAKQSVNNSQTNLPDEITLTKGRENMAMFMYTSGSTGKPKGVRLAHITAQLRLEWQWDKFPFSESEIYCLLKLSITFIDHFGEIWNPLLGGRTLVLIPKEFTLNPEKLVPILEKYKIERIVGVPTLIHGIILYVSMLDESLRLPYLRFWITSGEELTLTLARKFFECFKDSRKVLSNIYGATEVMGDVLTFEMTSMADLEKFEKIPIGRPTFNTQVYILDAFNKPVKDGEIGNIFISGGFVSDGYINSSGEEVFLENNLSSDRNFRHLYKMGDVGTIKDGLVFYHGRKDTQIKVHGHRVELNEVGSIIDKLSGLEKSVVHVYNRAKEDQKVLAFIKLKVTHASMTAEEVESELSKIMPRYMMPTVFLLQQFPFLASGKVDFHQLMTVYETSKGCSAGFDFTGVPAEKLETTRVVFETIAESIGKSCKRMTILSNFYCIGGDSLNTILCVTKLWSKNYQISIEDFLKAPTIGDIIGKVTEPGINSTLLEVPGGRNLSIEALSVECKMECIVMISETFLKKGEILKCVTGVTSDHLTNFLEPNWTFLVDRALSFVVRDCKKKIVGISLNYEIGDDLQYSSDDAPFKILLEYLEFVDKVATRARDISGLKVLEAFVVATSPDLDSSENVLVVSFIETNILKLAKSKNFQAVKTTNTSMLTQQIDTILGYETLNEIQNNQYKDKSGCQVFKDVDDSKKTSTMLKIIE